MKNLSLKAKRYITDAILILVLLGIDQALKQLALIHLKDHEDIELIEGFLSLHYLENNGAAFGMLKDQKAFFILITAVFFGLIAYIMIKLPEKKKYLELHIVIAVITSGALGNFIDRMRIDHVIDFIYFVIIDFPVFNFADICITVGTIWLVLLIIFKYKEQDLRFLSLSSNKYRKID